MSTLPPNLARALAANRERVVPVVGAGLALAANVPGTSEVAAALRAAAATDGISIPVGAGFVETCAAFEQAFGLSRMQDVTANTVLSRDPEPDPALRALVRCPSRIILTTNYDFSTEVAVLMSGRQPVSFGVDQAAAWVAPPDGVVHVVHLHGLATEPRTMVFPGESTKALETDDRFKTLLRAVVAPHVQLYLGFAFGATETHLRSELDWLAQAFTDAGEHHVLLPAGESSERGAELDELLAKPCVHAHLYDEVDSGHRAVVYAALLLAPHAPPQSETVALRARPRDEYFLAPPLLDARPGEDHTKLDSRVLSAELGLGTERFSTPQDLLTAGRVLLDAPPGMGKTETLIASGETAETGRSLLLRLPAIASQVGPGVEPLTAALRALRDAQAFDEQTPRPSVENLDGGSYCFLFDAFDEVQLHRRADVLAAVEAFVDRFPQHTYIAATRPTIDATPFYDLGFARYVLVPSAPWGQRYLEHRSVPPDRTAALYDRLPTARELLSVPVYASAIGARLVRDEDVPATPLALLTAAERDAILDDAEFYATGVHELFDYLQRLALVLQLRGSSEAPSTTLAEVTGKGVPETEDLRREMIERALLQDRDGIVAFPSRVMQEALCADALLSTDDPARTVEEVAAAYVAGELVIRGDLDHVLDLMWESADPAVRRRLRELDELRFARTQRPDVAGSAEEALDILWDWFERRRLWLTNDYNSRELRGAETAVERLLAADPERAERRRSALVDATRSASMTTRGNAVAWLTFLPRTDPGETLSWLLDRFGDENPVVRRHACVAAEQLQLPEALPAIHEQLAHETDTAAMEGLGRAALVLTPPDSVHDLALTLVRDQRVWRRVAGEVTERAGLATLLDLLGTEGLGTEDWTDLLAAAVERQTVDEWSADDVRSLSRALVRRARQGDIYQHLDAVQAIVARHPEAALSGAEEGSDGLDGLLTVDFVFLQGLPRETLAVAAQGRLGDLLMRLIPVGHEPRASDDR